MIGPYRNARTAIVVGSLLEFSRVLGASSVMTDPILEETSFVLDGVVESVGTRSFSEVHDTRRTFVLQLTDAPMKPTPISLARGERVTVRAGDGLPAPLVGSRLRILAKAWILGSGVAVSELRRDVLNDSSPPINTVEQEIRDAQEHAERSRVAARFGEARVLCIAVVLEELPKTLVIMNSEHDPQWRDVKVRVTHAYRGVVRNQVIAVRYPASMDFVWWRVPKPNTLNGPWLFALPGGGGNLNSVIDVRSALNGPRIEEFKDLLPPELP